MLVTVGSDDALSETPLPKSIVTSASKAVSPSIVFNTNIPPTDQLVLASQSSLSSTDRFYGQSVAYRISDGIFCCVSFSTFIFDLESQNEITI